MPNEILKFLEVVIHFWADWATGGPLVMAIALTAVFKGREFRRGILLTISAVFLFLGFFSAWEEQKQKRESAELEKDNYKQRSEYNQRRIDKLSDTPHRFEATNKAPPQSQIVSNAPNASIIQGNVSGHNIQIGGSNNTIYSTEIEDKIIRDFKMKLEYTIKGNWDTNYADSTAFNPVGRSPFADIVVPDAPIFPSIRLVCDYWEMTEVVDGSKSFLGYGVLNAGEFPTGKTMEDLINYKEMHISLFGAFPQWLHGTNATLTHLKCGFVINGMEKTTRELGNEMELFIPANKGSVVSIVNPFFKQK